jgi:3-mercaptopropionate dioxygenase
MALGHQRVSAIREISWIIARGEVTLLPELLARLQRAGLLDQESWFAPPLRERYSRRLIWRDPGRRFVVVGMSWAAGQSSVLHDHNGLWGAEVVVSGTMQETFFQLVGREAERLYRFDALGSRIAQAGSVSVVAPPTEYHILGNPGPKLARTVHVYCGELSSALTFTKENGNWYRAGVAQLQYDA